MFLFAVNREAGSFKRVAQVTDFEGAASLFYNMAGDGSWLDGYDPMVYGGFATWFTLDDDAAWYRIDATDDPLVK